MNTKSDCRRNQKFGLTLVWSNPQAKREMQFPQRWLLHSQNGDNFSVMVWHVGANRPRVIYKEAA
jgi:hypothetical protein